jgi:nitrous oxidase accessory protein
MPLTARTRGLAALAAAALLALGWWLLAPQGHRGGGATAPLLELQALIDAAKAGDELAPPAGVYRGPVVIDKAITIDGRNGVTIDAGGKGTVLTIKTDRATVRNLTLTNSGGQHNDVDAGIQIKGNFNIVKDNRITECLFGIDLSEANDNVVRRNTILSKQSYDIGIRGDAIRLWYSRKNRIEQNVIRHSRDMVVWYSADNIIAGNDVADGRYGMHFMYSKYNLVENNTFQRDSVGIFLMYSDSLVIRNNRVVQAQGAEGIGIGFKEASNCDIFDNQILYNSTGLYLDLSPFEPDTTNRIFRNKIAYNDLGVLFLNDWTGNVFKDNIFSANNRHVSVSGFAGAARNVWNGNYWDDYEGFDADRDGIGDKPYKMNVYADRLWMDVKQAAFFRASPVLTLLDFMERLAPFTEPLLMLQDNRPHTHPDFVPDAASATDRTSGNIGKDLETFGEATRADTRSGSSIEQTDPFGLYSGKKDAEGRLNPFGLDSGLK